VSLPAFRRNRWLNWVGLLAATTTVLLVALSPPLLSPTWRAAIMHGFSPLCHQLPSRSPVLYGGQIAICDRCVGIYLGLVVGIATVGGAHRLWVRLGARDRFVLLGSLVPMAVDWIGPILGLWNNGPISRALTGLVFGVVAASFVADRLLWGRIEE
jgi:uncharacterized membrane protein